MSPTLPAEALRGELGGLEKGEGSALRDTSEESVSPKRRGLSRFSSALGSRLSRLGSARDESRPGRGLDGLFEGTGSRSALRRVPLRFADPRTEALYARNLRFAPRVLGTLTLLGTAALATALGAAPALALEALADARAVTALLLAAVGTISLALLSPFPRRGYLRAEWVVYLWSAVLVLGSGVWILIMAISQPVSLVPASLVPISMAPPAMDAMEMPGAMPGVGMDVSHSRRAAMDALGGTNHGDIVPEVLPKGVPEVNLKPIPEVAPTKTPTVDLKPMVAPETKAVVTLEVPQEVTHEEVPEVTPEEVPEVIPEPAAELMPEGTGDDALEITRDTSRATNTMPEAESPVAADMGVPLAERPPTLRGAVSETEMSITETEETMAEMTQAAMSHAEAVEDAPKDEPAPKPAKKRTKPQKSSSDSTPLPAYFIPLVMLVYQHVPLIFLDVLSPSRTRFTWLVHVAAMALGGAAGACDGALLWALGANAAVWALLWAGRARAEAFHRDLFARWLGAAPGGDKLVDAIASAVANLNPGRGDARVAVERALRSCSALLNDVPTGVDKVQADILGSWVNATNRQPLTQVGQRHARRGESEPDLPMGTAEPTGEDVEDEARLRAILSGAMPRTGSLPVRPSAPAPPAKGALVPAKGGAIVPKAAPLLLGTESPSTQRLYRALTMGGAAPAAGALLERLVEWDFDVLALAAELHPARAGNTDMGPVLLVVGYALLRTPVLRVTRRFSKDQALVRFLRAIDAQYTLASYHNAVHGAMVAQKLFSLLGGMGLLDVLGDKGFLLAGLAALCHDVGHTGRSAVMLTSVNDAVCMLYNDRSPLENYHCCLLFRTLALPGCDVLALPAAEMQGARATVIELILATDMKHHFEHISRFKLTRQTQAGPNDLSEADLWSLTLLLLKLADLSHTCVSWPRHVEWLQRLCDEFYAQGAEEALAGLPVSPLCDISKHGGIAQSQIAFFNFAVRPLLVEVTSTDAMLRHAVGARTPASRRNAHCKPVEAITKNVARNASCWAHVTARRLPLALFVNGHMWPAEASGPPPPTPAPAPPGSPRSVEALVNMTLGPNGFLGERVTTSLPACKALPATRLTYNSRMPPSTLDPTLVISPHFFSEKP